MFWWSTRGVSEWLLLQSATMDNVNTEILGAIPVPVPPLQEQQAIVHLLINQTSKLDALITKVHEAIEKLKEYRTALISAAVTGKIDVREAVSVPPAAG